MEQPPESLPSASSCHSVREIAKHVDAEIEGDAEFEIKRITSLDQAQVGDMSFVAERRFLEQAKESRASALLISPDLDLDGTVTRLIVPDARVAFQRVTMLFYPPFASFAPGIHASACIHERAKLGAGVHVGPNVTIGADAQIGDGTTIRAGVQISEGVRIGSQCYLYPNVVVRSKVRIGDRVILQASAVIGADGFGFVHDGGRQHKVPQVGGVLIEDDVEIGANTCIDRGTCGDTIIGEGSKLDNLVQIAHNVRVGRHVLIVSQVGISGSTVIGDYAGLGGQSGVAGHLEIGEGAQIGGQAGVIGNVGAGAKIWGTPGINKSDFLRAYARFQKKSDAEARIRALEAKVEALSQQVSRSTSHDV